MSPQETVERALSLSGADGCVVIVEQITNANLRWANNTLTTNGVSRSDQVTVIAISGGAVGVVSRQGVTPDELSRMVGEADATAGGGPEAEDQAPLIGAEGNAGDWETAPTETSIEVFTEFAPALGHAFDAAASAGDILYGYASHEMVSTFVGTSAGLRARFDQPTGHTEINAKSADLARSAWAGVATTDFADVDVVDLASGLSSRLGWEDRKVELPPGRYETILPAAAVGDLMIPLYWAADARNAHDGRAVFSAPGGGTRVGQRLADAALSLRSDPDESQIRCSPFVVAHTSSSSRSVFDNGAATPPTEWIAEGVLSALVQTRQSARLTSLPFTPYVDNLILDGPDASGGTLEDLVARTERGLLLTCLWYIREVDPQTLLLTGLTRDGVYLVEGGEVVGAVNNFRFNESPVELLGRIIEAGDSGPTLPREWGDYFTRSRMPALRVSGFNMSSVSQAS